MVCNCAECNNEEDKVVCYFSVGNEGIPFITNRKKAKELFLDMRRKILVDSEISDSPFEVHK